jgi:hypothetical protein
MSFTIKLFWAIGLKWFKESLFQRLKLSPTLLPQFRHLNGIDHILGVL